MTRSSPGSSAGHPRQPRRALHAGTTAWVPPTARARGPPSGAPAPGLLAPVSSDRPMTSPGSVIPDPPLSRRLRGASGRRSDSQHRSVSASMLSEDEEPARAPWRVVVVAHREEMRPALKGWVANPNIPVLPTRVYIRSATTSRTAYDTVPFGITRPLAARVSRSRAGAGVLG